MNAAEHAAITLGGGLVGWALLAIVIGWYVCMHWPGRNS